MLHGTNNTDGRAGTDAPATREPGARNALVGKARPTKPQSSRVDAGAAPGGSFRLQATTAGPVMR